MLLQSQAASKGHHPHTPTPEALQNAAPMSQISIMGARGTFARISIMGAKETFARISIMGAKVSFARITIKIAKGIIVHDFSQRSSESVSKRIHKAQACLEMALDWR